MIRRRAILLLFTIVAVVTCITVTLLAVAGVSLNEPEDIVASEVLHLKINQLIPDPIANTLALVLPLVIGIVVGYIVGDRL